MPTSKEDDEFDIAEFCKRHLKVSAWANERNQVYTIKELREVISMAIEAFKKESALATLSPPCLIIGDIHGQYRDLIRILNCTNPRDIKETDKVEKKFGFSSNRHLFLGDYVDRGPHSVECICLVFSLKILFPTQYVLLRGNHETKTINFAYGFREELMTKLGAKEGIEIWERFNDAFSWMPIAGLVGTKILCMHGGLSPYLTSLDDIRKIPRPLPDTNESKLALDLLWSDPLEYGNIYSVNENAQYLKNPVRGLSVNFNEAAVKDTCRRLNIDLVVRAHQVMDNGFKFYADRKLLTIFSAPRYMNETNNKGAVLKVSETGAISITTMKSRQIGGLTPGCGEVTKGSSSEMEEALKVKERESKKSSESASKK